MTFDDNVSMFQMVWPAIVDAVRSLYKVTFLLYFVGWSWVFAATDTTVMSATDGGTAVNTL